VGVFFGLFFLLAIHHQIIPAANRPIDGGLSPGC